MFLFLFFTQNEQNAIEQLDDEKPRNKYSLRDPIDLRSKFLLDVEAHKLKKACDQKQQQIHEQLNELTILEALPEDEDRGNRRHAWIVILSNVEWAAKKCAGPDHKFDTIAPIQPFFIEPSTGTRFDANDANYFSIDSVWNENNYYVRLTSMTFGILISMTPMFGVRVCYCVAFYAS